MNLSPDTAPPARPLDEIAPLLEELVDHLDAMLAYWDRDEVCRFANAAYAEWFGRRGSDMAGTTLRDLLGPLYALNEPYIRAAYAGRKQVFERAIPLPGGQGVRHSLATYIPRIVDGRVEGMFVHVADVGPLKRLEAELREAKAYAESLAVHDPLTGLANRTQLHELLEDALRPLSARGDGCAVLAVDLDHFKSINDREGHLTGDQALIGTARRLADAVRSVDTVLRIGGDEFVVIAPEVETLADAKRLAERLVAACDQPLSIDGRSFKVSVSVGVAGAPWHGSSGPQLLDAADAAMYEAKRSGRSRWAMAKRGL